MNGSAIRQKNARCGKGSGLWAALLTVGLLIVCPVVALAAETRTAIDDINLNIDSNIEAGNSGGSVRVTTSDSGYSVGSAELVNESDTWMGGMTPRVSVELYARSGYYFSSASKGIFSFYGDDATFVTARREDDKETIVVVFKLDKLDNGDLSVGSAEWDESSGIASWDENPAAKFYQVRLYRDNSLVVSTRDVHDTSYDFGNYFTKKGDYYFTVRAVGGSSEKGDWESSDSWYVTASEADDISGGYRGPTDGYNSDGPGGTGGGPGATGNSGTGGTGYSTAAGTGNNWCLNQQGKWFQYSGGGYPVNRWELIDGKWYYFDQNGYVRYGWIELSGKWYYTDSNGAMLVNTKTPDGYYVGGDGAWIQ